MPAWEVVGTSVLNEPRTTFPEDFTLPLPAGTIVGDIIVVSYWGGYGAEVTDTRLYSSERLVSPDHASQGAWGEATDLSDIDLRFHGSYAALAIAVTVRTDMGTPTPYPTFPPFGEFPPVGVASRPAIGFVASWTDVTTGFSVGTSTGWTRLTGAERLTSSSDWAVAAFSYDGPLPVPDLEPTLGPDTPYSMSAYVLAWDEPYVTTRRSYLRQRQSPASAPSRMTQLPSPARARQAYR